MHSRVLLAICFILATATEALPVSAANIAWLKVADDTWNNVIYYVETKQELFVFGKAVPLAVPPSKTTPGTTTDTGSSVWALTTSTSTPTTSTSTPAISTNAPATSTSAPTTDIIALSTKSNALSPFSMIPPGYTYYPVARSFYKFHDSRVTWDSAKTTCEKEGAQLVVLKDKEEADIVASIVKDTGYSFTWTGLRDKRPRGEMEWLTIHGEIVNDVYHEWYDGRPYNDVMRTCALFSGTNKRLYDWPCDYTQYFICQLSQ